jgi:hypothetical protein
MIDPNVLQIHQLLMVRKSNGEELNLYETVLYDQLCAMLARAARLAELQINQSIEDVKNGRNLETQGGGSQSHTEDEELGGSDT